MINTFSHIKKKSSFTQRLLPALFMLAVAVVIFWYHGANIKAPAPGALVFAAAGTALLLPFIGQKVFFLITFLGSLIGFVFLNAAAVCFYYLLLTPLALCLRTLRKNQISLKFSDKKNTSCQDHLPVRELTQYMKQY